MRANTRLNLRKLAVQTMNNHTETTKIKNLNIVFINSYSSIQLYCIFAN